MKIFELFANKSQKQAILNSSDILIGFEFEVILKPSDEVTWQEGSKGNFRLAAKDISKLFGVEVEIPSALTDKDKSNDKWYIETDTSLRGDGIAAEIVTKPYPISEAFGVLNRFGKWMAQKGHSTNDSTGLHVNVSIVGKNYNDYDFLKLMMFYDEKYTLSLFQRIGNSYAKNMKERYHNFRDKIVNLEDMSKGNRSFEKITPMLKTFGNALRELMHKHSTLNLRDNGVVEIRGFGNTNYEQRDTEVKRIVLDVASAMRIASDPSIMAAEYVKRFVELLNGRFDADDKLQFKKDVLKWMPSINNLVMRKRGLRKILFQALDFKGRQDAVYEMTYFMLDVYEETKQFLNATQINEIRRYMKNVLDFSDDEIKEAVDAYNKEINDIPEHAR